VATIPFTRGVPDASLLPVDDLRSAAAEAFQRDPAGTLSYAVGGYRPLREWIAGRHGVDPGRVLLLNGSLQGVAFLAQHLFLGQGGRALVEDPTYDRTLILLRTFGAEVSGVPLREDGIDVAELERVLAAHRDAHP
jgi:DNA-binding transcriptional MocR family regulator